MTAPAALSCANLSWSIKGTPIVQGVDLNVRPGETLGLVGPNGSGKSTLIKLLSGLLQPEAGEVYLNGHRLAGMRRRDIAQSLAVVEQHADTTDAVSVVDAVELGRTPWLSALAPWSAVDDAIVSQALEQVDADHLRDRPWQGLSGGERQRVHIARALAQKPSVLLLDEPTNHLDIAHQLAIFELIRSLSLTTLIALHDLNQALGCDRVGVMEAGRLVALGRPQEVLTPQCLKQTFGVEAHYLTDPVDGSRLLHLRPVRSS